MQSIPVVMDHGLFAIAVVVFFLDDSLGLRLALLDHGAVAVTMLADGHAGADGTRADTDVIGKRGRRDGANDRSGE